MNIKDIDVLVLNDFETLFMRSRGIDEEDLAGIAIERDSWLMIFEPGSRDAINSCSPDGIFSTPWNEVVRQGAF